MFIDHLVLIFDEVKRILRPDGLLFVNLADSYSGSGKGPTGHNGMQNAETRQGFESGYLRENGEWSKGGRKSKTGGTAGIPPKNLLLIPERFAIGMQDRGWWVRSEIVWAKISAMPESVRDRPTSGWEPIWMFAKSRTYYWDQEAVRQLARSTHDSGNGYARPNLRNFWLLDPEPSRLARYASFITEIPRRCILAATSEKGACPACGAPWVRMAERGYRATPKACKGPTRTGKLAADDQDGNRGINWARDGHIKGLVRDDTTLGWQQGCACPPAPPVPQTVLDPFLGSGTTALVADRLGRDAIGIELNPAYAEMARRRIESDAPMLTADAVTVEASATQLALMDGAAG